ncbi:GCN5-related N-acetyltransferase [Parvibaculum lavamentivorans DS-1]|uniref:GCN5-related N-acetyltransferase n=1 Tax=Parvibaculum lavamentivorans (strain DS-1 / DSM 13023 / NCIMB 13966) TaxID=402881 RepID=A7HT68_PARL1|nr:GNAT family N-acetyltransferase [Parvibaculum lavamentivorans]ABS63101.1 GCN5-related N-acetyltransferase [Parvibaculum lavamentivorans DS-1]
MQEELKTEQLLLRPLRETDAERLAGLANNWNIARMLSRMPYPYALNMAQDWIARTAAERAEGEEFVYAVTNGEGFIGTCGIQAHANGTHEIGYWIGEPYWNRGYATEAARAVLADGITRFGAETIVSGHYWENHASGRVLTKLGFRYTGEEYRWCAARQEKVRCLTMRLARLDN